MLYYLFIYLFIFIFDFYSSIVNIQRYMGFECTIWRFNTSTHHPLLVMTNPPLHPIYYWINLIYLFSFFFFFLMQLLEKLKVCLWLTFYFYFMLLCQANGSKTKSVPWQPKPWERFCSESWQHESQKQMLNHQSTLYLDPLSRYLMALRPWALFPQLQKSGCWEG